MKKYYLDLQYEIERNEKRSRLHEETIARHVFDQYAHLERELARDERKCIKDMQKEETSQSENQRKMRDTLYLFIFQRMSKFLIGQFSLNYFSPTYRNELNLMKEEYENEKQILQTSERAQKEVNEFALEILQFYFLG
jgi:hypothetical protein